MALQKSRKFALPGDQGDGTKRVVWSFNFTEVGDYIG